MGNVKGGWKKASVYNPADGTVVQMNLLSTEHSSFDPDNIKSETPTGQAFGGMIKPLVIGFLEADGLPQLKTWMTGHTLLNAVVFVPGGQHILFHEDEEFFEVPGGGVNARDGVVIHRIETEAIGEDPQVLKYQNLAEAITFTADAGDLVFPLQGPKLTLAADYANLGATNPTLKIEAKDYGTNGTDGAVLATASKTITAAGRHSVVITLPATTYLLSIDLVGGGSADVTNVSLRSDDKTGYITY